MFLMLILVMRSQKQRSHLSILLLASISRLAACALIMNMMNSTKIHFSDGFEGAMWGSEE